MKQVDTWLDLKRWGQKTIHGVSSYCIPYVSYFRVEHQHRQGNLLICPARPGIALSENADLSNWIGFHFGAATGVGRRVYREVQNEQCTKTQNTSDQYKALSIGGVGRSFSAAAVVLVGVVGGS